MSTPVLPVIIRGPGIVVHNSYAYYFGTEGVKVKIARKTEKTEDDFYGHLDETSHGGPMVDLEFTPTGMIRSLVKPFPYGPTNLVAGWYTGASILSGTTYIQTKAGQRILYQRSGISKCPTLTLSPRKQVFGSMTISAINKIDVQPTDAAALKVLSSTAFADTTFDETKIIKDIYTATLGTRLSPFDAIGARNGFEVEFTLGIDDVEDDNVGVADKLLTSVQAKVKFAPNNLTEAQVDELAQWQGTDAILAGQSVSRGPGSVVEDLVIDADALTVTLHKAGLVTGEHGYGAKLDRNGNLEFVSRMGFTTGAPNPILSLVVN